MSLSNNTYLKKEKQPKGLYLLFATGLWERFGFYTLQAIIMLYMSKELLMTDTDANLLYAAFSSLLYITPIIGGYLADKYLGFKRAIIIGGTLFIIAYLLSASQNQTIFFLGLSLLICANGLFKPNISSIVGDLYHKNDPRRDSGFTIFYMGINVGAFIPPAIAGFLVSQFGWHSGFYVAAAGMLLGQIIFIFGNKYLTEPTALKIKQKTSPPTFLFYILLTLGTLFFIGLCQIAFHHPQITNSLVGITAIAIALIVALFTLREPPGNRIKIFAILILIAISVGFWSLYAQTFSSIMLFADRNMNKSILGIPLPPEATQSFNPLFIILLSPLFSRLWIRMDEIKLNPSTQTKFALGVFFMSAGFLLLGFGTKFFGNNGIASAWWLCSSYLLQTIGELMISPIGLAMITVLCPKNLVGMMMGIWFFSQAASFALGGMLANIAALPPAHLSAAQSLPIYSHAFTIYGELGLVMTLISLIFIPFLNRMIK